MSGRTRLGDGHSSAMTVWGVRGKRKEESKSKEREGRNVTFCTDTETTWQWY